MAQANSAPSDGAAERRRTRDWASLLPELPYYAIVILGVIGVFWTSLFRTPSTKYWVIVTPIAGLLSIAVGWRHSRPDGRLAMVATEVGQWAAVLVAMYLVKVSDVRGLINASAMGRTMLTLLALGVFVSGLNLRAWKLCVAGGFLAVAVPLVAWFEQAALVLLIIAVVLIALGLLLWWVRAQRSAGHND
jgi:hypothetical protein